MTISISEFDYGNRKYIFNTPIEIIVNSDNRGQYKMSNEYFEIYSRGETEKIAFKNFKTHFVIAYNIYRNGYFGHLAQSLQDLQTKFFDDVKISRKRVKQ